MKIPDLTHKILLGKERKERKLVGRGDKHNQKTHEWSRGTIEKNKSTHEALWF
jgi:hypothetical protein